MFLNRPLDKGLVSLSPARQRRPATAVKIAEAGRRRRAVALCVNGFRRSGAAFWLCRLFLFDVLLKFYWLAGPHAGQLRPLVREIKDVAHLIEELRVPIIVPPAPGIAKLDEILLPTLDQSEPSASNTVVRTLLPFRHQESQTAVESALHDNQRASLIRATKMSAAPSRLFVDF